MRRGVCPISCAPVERLPGTGSSRIMETNEVARSTIPVQAKGDPDITSPTESVDPVLALGPQRSTVPEQPGQRDI